MDVVDICKLASTQGWVSEDWRKDIIVPLYEGKGRREDCNSYRGDKELSVPGKA